MYNNRYWELRKSYNNYLFGSGQLRFRTHWLLILSNTKPAWQMHDGGSHRWFRKQGLGPRLLHVWRHGFGHLDHIWLSGQRLPGWINTVCAPVIIYFSFFFFSSFLRCAVESRINYTIWFSWRYPCKIIIIIIYHKRSIQMSQQKLWLRSGIQ